ncbi:Pyridoxal phosphate-dependent transferase [Pseudocohnilembus persalinus]|uniref:Pyridoxal phosphate-dependent transferase n=1 Tax=Pseudocohnilembus persalinus TaxID=266149 RepID=A0A0V0Q953_PSEPJ|nr:Pyridoxal phosphate-dependent transferase [Pseudocohnilembus persalinus]|eukprot:KRW98564.1 Pyridoxal phosphate-dependent transferase [Pseudocohnilembus persalinus]
MSYNFGVKDLSMSLLNAEYAVRGKVPTRAGEIQKILDKGNNQDGKSYPFTELTEANIGNPQTFGQPPISFFRQVLSGILNPDLIEEGAFKNQDVVNRVKFYQKNIKGNVGAYTNSLGYEFVRQSIANFIAKRDNLPVEKDLTNYMTLDGASQGVHLIMNAFVAHSSDGVMVPIPQYPLYSAAIALKGGQQVPYYLDEENQWQCSMEELERAYTEAKSRKINPKILVVINPGNPCGNILTEETIKKFIKFAYDKKMIIIADEVYQTNIYNKQKKFHSFKKIQASLEAPYNKGELFSVHSTSKGILGECGIRGGYMEMINVDPEVKAQLVKLKSINLCSNTTGQLMTELMCNPPSEDNGASQESIKKYNQEVEDLFNGLLSRINTVNKYLNSLKNIKSQDSEGAMYVFPQVILSKKAIEAAKKEGQSPDLFYCLNVLENTGLVIVPGSGFGQVDGTYHFRITNLIRPESKLEDTLKRFKEYNEKFHQQYE